jgi:hypothetical protein
MSIIKFVEQTTVVTVLFVYGEDLGQKFDKFTQVRVSTHSRICASTFVY